MKFSYGVEGQSNKKTISRYLLTYTTRGYVAYRTVELLYDQLFQTTAFLSKQRH